MSGHRPGWTREDYRAAGEWLAEASVEDATNRAAVGGYVEAVAPHDPRAAAQWVETLPQGDARRTAAETVFRSWRGEDEAAAKRLAEAEGVE
jgi:hypothetical protein